MLERKMVELGRDRAQCFRMTNISISYVDGM